MDEEEEEEVDELTEDEFGGTRPHSTPGEPWAGGGG